MKVQQSFNPFASLTVAIALFGLFDAKTAIAQTAPPTDSNETIEASNPAPLTANDFSEFRAAADLSALTLDSSPSPDEPIGQFPDARRFRDVSPGDWAFEALTTLSERYDCLVGYPDGTFRGNRPLTRYEFAAGLNACLNQIERLLSADGNFIRQEDLDALRDLLQEFNAELALLQGRVDGLEARVTDLENTQFSTTTKLFGQVVVGVQGRSEGEFENLLNRNPDTGNEINVITNAQLSLFTQFSPNSLLITGLQAGDGNTIGGNFNENYVGLSYEGDTDNSLEISDLSYRHLIANRVAVIVGPVGVNAVNVFRGSNRIESAGFGPLSRFAQRNPVIAVGGGSAGVGFDWQISNNFSLQGVYSTNLANDSVNGGIFGGDQGVTSAGLQLVASPTEDIDVAFQYINSYSPNGSLGTGVGDSLLVVPTISGGFLRGPIQTNAFGLGTEWRIAPQVTLGGWGGFTTSDFKGGSGGVDTYNWMAYANFPDFLGEGNLAGIFFGQPPKISSSDLPVGRNVPNTFVTTLDKVLAGELGDAGGQPDTTYHLEAFYRWRVTDNISITPGAIVIFNPGHNSNNSTIGIGAIRATLTF